MFGKLEEQILVKSYYSPFSGGGLICEVLENDLISSLVDIDCICVNYGRSQKIKSWLGAGRQLSYEGAESFLGFDKEGVLVFQLSKVLDGGGLGEDSLVFFVSIVLDGNVSMSSANGIMSAIDRRSQVHSGYVRKIKKGASAITEKVIERGLFGGVKSVVPQWRSDWLVPSASGRNVVDGAIRGIYPINMWSKQVFVALAEIGVVLPGDNGYERLQEFDSGRQEWLLKNNPRFVKYFHFGTE